MRGLSRTRVDMDYETAMRELGLPKDARIEQVRRAYTEKSRTLKELMTSALRAEQKEEYRVHLRKVFCCREVALGRKPPEDWMVERFAISSTSLMSRLGIVTSKGLDRKTARAFLGLPRDATQTSILDAYKLRSRVLVRRLARAKADDELALVHRSRNALRGVRDLAI